MIRFVLAVVDQLATNTRLLAALVAAATAALSLGLLPHPWADVVTVVVAAISAAYIPGGSGPATLPPSPPAPPTGTRPS